MATNTTATVIGSTGLVGSSILNHLLAYPSVLKVATLVRRPSPHTIIDADSKLKEAIDSSTTNWPSVVPNIVPAPSSAFFSALGTTRADAGGLERQRTIDHDLNVELAKAAKAAGVKTYVLISSMGANSKSWNLYSAMKGQTEDDVMAIGFERTVFVRPGLIVGQRDVPRWNERPLHMLANLLGGIAPILKDAWAQDADTVARAAVRAGVDNAVWMGRSLVDGKEGGKVWFMSQSEIVELGKR